MPITGGYGFKSLNPLRHIVSRLKWIPAVPKITAHWIRCSCGTNIGYGKRQNDRMLPLTYACGLLTDASRVEDNCGGTALCPPLVLHSGSLPSIASSGAHAKCGSYPRQTGGGNC